MRWEDRDGNSDSIMEMRRMVVMTGNEMGCDVALLGLIEAMMLLQSARRLCTLCENLPNRKIVIFLDM